MEKFKNFVKQKRNLLIMIGEIILIIVFASVFLVQASITPAISPNVTSSDTSAKSSSNTISAISSDLTSSDLFSSSETSSSIDSVVSNSQNSSNSSSTTPSYMTWADDKFLPSLNTAYPVLDCIVGNKLSSEETLMFTSLEGVINGKQPRIYMTDNDPNANVPSWIDTLKLKFNPIVDPYTLIGKYKSEIKGIIIYDDSNLTVADTINLATTMAGVEHGLIVSPKLVNKIQNLYHFPIIKDLRGMFNNKWDVYNYQLDNYADRTVDRVMVGLPPSIMGNIRDYAIAIGANVINLDPDGRKDSTIMDSFFSKKMPSGKSIFMGWWTNEGPGVEYASRNGVATVASDWSSNLSVFSGMKVNITKQKEVAPPPLQNKIYIAMILSDGDNLQYVQGRLPEIWNQADRGVIPLSWTFTPSTYDLAQPMLDYFLKTATPNDCLVDGPSAYGYLYPNLWQNKTTLATYLKNSNKYLDAIGLKAITTWNRAEMKSDYLQLYANNMPSLIGITQQDTMVNPVQMVNKNFIALQLNASYCSEVFQMKNALGDNIKSFDGSKPMFLTIQGVPWGTMGKISNYIDIANYYKMMSPYVQFVRLDQLMRLESQYKNSGK